MLSNAKCDVSWWFSVEYLAAFRILVCLVCTGYGWLGMRQFKYMTWLVVTWIMLVSVWLGPRVVGFSVTLLINYSCVYSITTSERSSRLEWALEDMKAKGQRSSYVCLKIHCLGCSGDVTVTPCCAPWETAPVRKWLKRKPRLWLLARVGDTPIEGNHNNWLASRLPMHTAYG